MYRGTVLRELRGNKARVLGELVDTGGVGLALLGRPPMLGEVAFDDVAAPRFPLTEGCVIAKSFERFWLFHPYAEGGKFLFALIQPGEWIDRGAGPEPLRMGAAAELTAAVNQNWVAQIRSGPWVGDPTYLPRLARVERIRLVLSAGATRFQLWAVSPATEIGTGTYTRLGPRDARLCGIPATGPNALSQYAIQVNSNVAQVNLPSFSDPMFDYARMNASDETRELVIDKEMVVAPGTGILVYGEPSAAGAVTAMVSFQVREEVY